MSKYRESVSHIEELVLELARKESNKQQTLWQQIFRLHQLEQILNRPNLEQHFEALYFNLLDQFHQAQLSIFNGIQETTVFSKHEGRGTTILE